MDQQLHYLHRLLLQQLLRQVGVKLEQDGDATKLKVGLVQL